jgi:tellurite methyltransferase
MLAPHVRLAAGERLDPRPAADFASSPDAAAVNIPADELRDRMHELPPASCTVQVADFPPWAGLALDALRQSQRVGVVVPAGGTASAGGARRRLWRPSADLEATIERIETRLPQRREPPLAIDFGCGSGRDAVFLAARGWRVAGIDVLPDALALAGDLARRYAPQAPVEWRCVDLEAGVLDIDLDAQLYVMVRYLNRDLLRLLAARAAAGAQLFLATFSALHRATTGRPRREALVIQPGELVELFADWQVVHHESGWCDGGHIEGFLAQR